jgi:Signal transduction histidine kinase regulating citrate/malate metabolism
MELFWTILSITLVQIPAIILRYIPFSKLVTQKQKKSLIYCYSINFLFQNILLLIIIVKTNVNIDPLFYKISIMCGAIIYFCINCLIIKKMFYQHIFIYGMQSIYSLLLHSFVAVILSAYSNNISLNRQFMIQSFTYLILFAITIYPLWKVAKNSFILNISSEHDYYWNIIWLIPFLLFFGNTIVTMNENWINTWRQLVSRLSIGVALFAIWKCTNLDFKELKEKQSLKSTNKLLHIQMEAIRQQSENIRENDEKIRILRHDIRHNVQMLSFLIQNGELDSASQILAQLDDDLESTKPIVFCKNPVINSSLLVYINRAQKENIEIISEIDIPQNIPWNSSDIAILFANVLENAINASCQQQKSNKEIRINTRYSDKKLAIVVKNRFNGEVLFNNAGMPISMEAGHGIGMSSVSTIVSRYHGHVVCSHEKGWFTISFMFSEYFVNNM